MNTLFLPSSMSSTLTRKQNRSQGFGDENTPVLDIFPLSVPQVGSPPSSTHSVAWETDLHGPRQEHPLPSAFLKGLGRGAQQHESLGRKGSDSGASSIPVGLPCVSCVPQLSSQGALSTQPWFCYIPSPLGGRMEPCCYRLCYPVGFLQITLI